MRTGIYPGSFKPFHAGHYDVLLRAADENDTVTVFASTAPRTRKGEFPIYAETIEQAWNEHFLKLMPPNVKVEFVTNPIRATYEKLNAAPTEEFTVYLGHTDAGNFAELAKYAPGVRVKVTAVKRTRCSGTLVRKSLQDRDFETFSSMMPAGVDLSSLWKLFLAKTVFQEFVRSSIKTARR